MVLNQQVPARKALKQDQEQILLIHKQELRHKIQVG